METQINAENIQTVNELINFLKSTNLFCKSGKREAIKFFSKFDKNELIDNIENIPIKWIIHFCSAIKGKTIERFRNRMDHEYYAYLWASEFKGQEIELMRTKIISSCLAFSWALRFRGKEIEYMRTKITDDFDAYLWALEFKGVEIDYMLEKVKNETYKSILIELKQKLNSND